MTSVLSRLSEAAATSLMCSGRLAALLARTRIDVETELGCDHDLLADRGKRLAHQFLVGERAVDFGGVEKCNATLDGRPDQRDSRLLIDRRTVAKAQSHAAEPDGRDFQIAVSKFALLHCLLQRLLGRSSGSLDHLVGAMACD